MKRLLSSIKKGEKSPKIKRKVKMPKWNIGFLRTISGKVLFSFGLLTTLLIVSSVVSYVNNQKLAQEITNVTERDMLVNTKMQELLRALIDIELGQRGYVITGSEDSLTPYNNGKETVESSITDLKSSVTNEEQISRLESIYENYNFWVGYVDRVVETRQYNGAQAASLLLSSGQGQTYIQELRSEVETLLSEESNLSKERIASLNSQVLIAQGITGILSLLSIILAFFFAITLSKTIKRTVNTISSSILEIANAGGDLTKRIHVTSKDELAGLANDTNLLIEGIAKLVREVASMSEHVSASSQQLLASSEETSRTIESISQTTLEIASGSEETSTKMQDALGKMSTLEESTNSLQSQTVQMEQSSSSMRQAAEDGRNSIDHVVNKMNQLQFVLGRSNDTVQSLGQKSTTISSMIKGITDIADQTNLLALNAAIEAARAGQHGKGFAVVADEVRKLAEQSQVTANEITNVVASIQEEIKTLLSHNDENMKEMKQSVDSSLETKSVFETILSQIEKTTADIANISSHIYQTKSLSGDVKGAFDYVSQIAKTTAMNSEQTAAASEEGSAAMEQMTASAAELSRQAEDLQRLVGNFKM
ncbi:methyl-accepting chemotaxis protein [Mangrovibacillus cuniculi]|uniref:Chemotaxis protein n=1 Tax=Mangrovibacillus cuniculi TaxID=2593652 RepID=A0A7S8HFC3_9BACI|nr:methyl-accepting chemotaxis protein [Mangrovibacillus cuniculi]QPC46612.1 chemotaxis protein [Mangrovibacillus cuniculi]